MSIKIKFCNQREWADYDVHGAVSACRVTIDGFIFCMASNQIKCKVLRLLCLHGFLYRKKWYIHSQFTICLCIVCIKTAIYVKKIHLQQINWIVYDDPFAIFRKVNVCCGVYVFVAHATLHLDDYYLIYTLIKMIFELHRCALNTISLLKCNMRLAWLLLLLVAVSMCMCILYVRRTLVRVQSQSQSACRYAISHMNIYQIDDCIIIATLCALRNT